MKKNLGPKYVAAFKDLSEAGKIAHNLAELRMAMSEATEGQANFYPPCSASVSAEFTLEEIKIILRIYEKALWRELHRLGVVDRNADKKNQDQ